MVILSDEDRSKVDTTAWGEGINVEDPADLTKKKITGYLLYRRKIYIEDDLTDENLWECFKGDFEGWTVDIFNLSDADEIRRLRDYLREHGVYVRKALGSKIAPSLEAVLNDDDFHEWTPEEVQHQVTRNKNFFSRFHPNNTSNQSVQQPGQDTSNQSVQQPEQVQQPPLPPIQPFLQQYQTQQVQPFPLQLGTAIPKVPFAELGKLYTEERKYSGEAYDVLTHKLQIFQDYCGKVGILPEQFSKAFSIMLKGRAATFYYSNLCGKNLTFDEMVRYTRLHFETDEHQQQYLLEWKSLSLQRMVNEHPDKNMLQCLELLFDKLQNIQQGLGNDYMSDRTIRDQVISACQGVQECKMALQKPAATFEGICSDLRSAIGNEMRMRNPGAQQFHAYDDRTGAQHDQYWVDRTYNRRGRGRGRGNPSSRGSDYQERRYQRDSRQKKCYICGKPGCWSTTHPPSERQQARDRFRSQYTSQLGSNPMSSQYGAFLAEYEGIEWQGDDDVDEATLLMLEMNTDDNSHETFFTEFGSIDGPQTIAILNDQSVLHALTKEDIFKDKGNELDDKSAFTFSHQYSSSIFQGIMPDTGAAGVSTAGEPQYLALQQLDPSVQLDTSTEGHHRITFGKGKATSKGTIQVQTPFGMITFHVVPTNTPFLWCIDDMDRMNVKFNNLENTLIQGNKVVPVVRKFGHPWLLLHQKEQSLAWSHLTTSEMRRLHRRFGHPSVDRLMKVLQRAGIDDIDGNAIKHITRYCHQCQMHSKSPGRFKFSLQDDYHFNYEVIVDVMYIDSKPVLHVVDSATAFQAARFLKDMSAKTIWYTL